MQLQVTDVASAGYGFPWGHTRSYSNQQDVDFNRGNGWNWNTNNLPWFSAPQLAGSAIVLNADLYNLRYFSQDASGNYAPQFGDLSTLARNVGAQQFTLRDPDGSVWIFNDFTAANRPGGFVSLTSPGGTVLSVTSTSGNQVLEVQRSLTSGGVTTTDSLLYAYFTSGDSSGQLQSCTLRRKVGAGAWENISQVVYTYYGSSDANGILNDLRTAARQLWQSASSTWGDVGTDYYRYYKAGDTKGDIHDIKFVCGPQAFANLSANTADPFTASDSVVSLYADNYFEYDSNDRATLERVNAGSMTFTYAYAQNPRFAGSSSSSSSSGSTPDLNAWVFKTTETRPDGSQQITYANFAGQTMLSVLVVNGTDNSGNSSSSSSGTQPTQWCTFFKYNTQGQVVLQASPSAVTGYDEAYNDLLRYLPANSKYQYLRDNDGLISLTEFYAAPATPVGYLKAEKIQKGQLGTPILLKSYEYGSQTAGSTTIYPLSKEIVYPDDVTSATTIETSYTYTYHSGTVQVQQQTTTLPVIATGQNGSGSANTQKEYFDSFGYLTWSMDERGFITNTTYDVPTGGVTQQIEDVDTSVVSGAPSGWTTPAGGGLNLTTDYMVDTLGRTTQSLGPAHTLDISGTGTSVRRAEWTVYDDPNFTTRTAGGYQTVSSGAFTLINPVGIVITNQNGNTTNEIAATRASTSGKLQPTDTFAQTSYVRWTAYQYTDCCKLSSKRVYHLIPSSGSGSSGTNYNQTDFGYDTSNRQNRIKTPGGTITFTTFNSRNLPVTVKVGTDDSGSGTDNMRTVTASVYDNGTAGGDGNLTQATQYVDATTTRVTSYTYDFRNRRLTTDGEVEYFQKLTYDNLDRIVKVERYNTTGAGTLIGRGETKFDDLSRVYQTIRYAVNPTTGSVGNSLTDNLWYDPAGNEMKSLPAGAKIAAKTTYDGVNRPLIRFQGYNLSDTNYATAGSVTGDTIFEQNEMAYDPASNVIQSMVRQRYDNATGTGPLTTPSGSQPKARVTYAASWQDGLGRVVASADYGTNGGTALSRPSTIPSRSDNILVSSATYNNDGEAYLLTDPASRMTYLEFDDAGRRTKLVENYLASSSSSSSSSGNTCAPSSDANRTTNFTYSPDGNLATLTAINADTTNQTTTYTYGTTLTDSDIAASLLLRQVAYPDSTGGSDVVSYKYNRQTQRKETTDQLGTVHAFDFDGLGRITQDRVTALGTNVDGAVRRLQTSYEVRGMPSLLTSYDNATVGSGSIVNEVGFSYNDFGQITKDQQSHSGAVGGAAPNVQYAYANGSANTIRPTQMMYPSGRQLNLDYGAANSQADLLSRIASLIDNDGTTHLADYTYLGLGTPVVVDYTQPDVKYTLIGTAGGDDPDTGDIYRGLDRLGRVKDAYWYDYGSSSDAARIKYGYNRVSNRTYRADPVAVANGAQYEELYAYDGLQRLSRFNRGTLNGTNTGLTAQAFAQCWTLDPTGNWKGFRQDDTGDGTWDLIQARTENAVNEITGITETAGPSWADAAYNAVGNMTTIPQSSDPTKTYVATFDSWNRLVKLVDGANTVVEYEYDSRTYRTVAKNYTGGVLSETRHYYYTVRWQIIEERLGSSTTPDRQFAWGLRYIDDLVLRDRSVSGTLDERLYALQDGNWNVIALSDTNGNVQERYSYQAYGTPKFLSAAFADRTNSSYAWETLYSGCRYDKAFGQYCTRYRYLASHLGCWISRDKMGYHAGLNLYQYTHNSPITFVDPFGLEDKELEPINVAAYQTGFESHPGDTNAVQKRALDFDAKARGWNSAKELMDQLQERSSNNRCINELRIHGHGWRSYGSSSGLPGSQGKYPKGQEPDPNPNPGGGLQLGLYLGPKGLGNKESFDAGGRHLGHLEKRCTNKKIVFCKPCKIRLYFCRVGDDFAKELARITKCRVFYSRGICSPVIVGNKELPGQAIAGPGEVKPPDEPDNKTPGGPSWSVVDPDGTQLSSESCSEITKPSPLGTNKMIPQE